MTESPTEEQLAAFSDFYRAEFTHVLRFLSYQGATWEEAAEATQEAFTKLLDSWSEVRAPRAWVRKVSERIYIRMAKAQKRVTGVGSDLLLEQNLRPSPDPPWASAVEAQEIQEVRALLSHLPDTQRYVLMLHMFDVNNREIAQELKIAESTVRSHIRHSRSRLMRLLNRQDARAGDHLASLTHPRGFRHPQPDRADTGIRTSLKVAEDHVCPRDAMSHE